MLLNNKCSWKINDPENELLNVRRPLLFQIGAQLTRVNETNSCRQGTVVPSPCQGRRVLLDSTSLLAPGHRRWRHSLMALTPELINSWPQTKAVCFSHDPRKARNVQPSFFPNDSLV